VRGSWFFVDILAESFPPPPQLFGDTKFVRVLVTVMGPEEPKMITHFAVFISLWAYFCIFFELG